MSGPSLTPVNFDTTVFTSDKDYYFFSTAFNKAKQPTNINIIFVRDIELFASEGLVYT